MLRLVLSVLLVLILAGLAAAESAGLDRALDRLDQDLRLQREQSQQAADAQRQQLQQQQDLTLRFQLIQPAHPLTCTRVGFTVFCR
ncbi:MAG: hypothetical protein DMD79_06860 [Candidatus Rokuibacteriota bacterium]|nr:MAG: hypothetical protein DMD79_06860 [Candidatus Rokubacteria bacterium]